MSQCCKTSGGNQKGRDLRGLYLTTTGPEEGRQSQEWDTAESGQSLNPVGTLRSRPLEEEEGTTQLGKLGPLPCGNHLKSDAALSDQLELTQI